MDVLEKHGSRFASVLVAKGWKNVGARRFVGPTHIVEILPAGSDGRVTVAYGRCATAGDPRKLAYVTRTTFAEPAEVEAFLRRL